MTICQAKGSGFDSRLGQNINEKKDDNNYSFCQTIRIHSALLKSKSVDDHRLEYARVKKDINKILHNLIIFQQKPLDPLIPQDQETIIIATSKQSE